MTLTISDNILKSAGLTEQQFVLEIATSLYQRKVLSLGKAAAFANLHRMEFQKILAEYKIPIHFSEEELNRDLATLERLL